MPRKKTLGPAKLPTTEEYAAGFEKIKVTDDTLTPRGTYRIKIDGDWLPLTKVIMDALGIKDGEEVECFVTHGQLIVRKVGLLKDG